VVLRLARLRQRQRDTADILLGCHRLSSASGGTPGLDRLNGWQPDIGST